MAGPNEEKYAYLRQLTIDKLLELLSVAPIPTSSPEDEAYVDALEEAIIEKEHENPIGFLPDVNQQWAEFQKYYDVTEKSPFPNIGTEIDGTTSVDQENFSPSISSKRTVRFRRIWRTALIAAGLAVCTFGCMIVAQAAGLDVFGTIARWTEETFSFVINDDTDSVVSESSTSISVSPEHAAYYEEIQAALSDAEISDTLVPSWYPDGFEASAPRVANTNKSATVTTMFSHKDGRHFLLSIARYNSSSDLAARTFEKDASLVEQYTYGTKTFYIFSNLNTVTATWSDGLLLVNISGDLTVNELKSVINSIGGL